MTERTRTDGASFVVWPQDPEDGVAEKAILVETYHDVFTIQQGKSAIMLNYEVIPELIKLLMRIDKVREIS